MIFGSKKQRNRVFGKKGGDLDVQAEIEGAYPLPDSPECLVYLDKRRVLYSSHTSLFCLELGSGGSYEIHELEKSGKKDFFGDLIIQLKLLKTEQCNPSEDGHASSKKTRGNGSSSQYLAVETKLGFLLIFEILKEKLQGKRIIKIKQVGLLSIKNKLGFATGSLAHIQKDYFVYFPPVFPHSEGLSSPLYKSYFFKLENDKMIKEEKHKQNQIEFKEVSSELVVHELKYILQRKGGLSEIKFGDLDIKNTQILGDNTIEGDLLKIGIFVDTFLMIFDFNFKNDLSGSKKGGKQTGEVEKENSKGLEGTGDDPGGDTPLIGGFNFAAPHDSKDEAGGIGGNSLLSGWFDGLECSLRLSSLVMIPFIKIHGAEIIKIEAIQQNRLIRTDTAGFQTNQNEEKDTKNLIEMRAMYDNQSTYRVVREMQVIIIDSSMSFWISSTFLENQSQKRQKREMRINIENGNDLIFSKIEFSRNQESLPQEVSTFKIMNYIGPPRLAQEQFIQVPQITTKLVNLSTSETPRCLILAGMKNGALKLVDPNYPKTFPIDLKRCSELPVTSIIVKELKSKQVRTQTTKNQNSRNILENRSEEQKRTITSAMQPSKFKLVVGTKDKKVLIIKLTF